MGNADTPHRVPPFVRRHRHLRRLLDAYVDGELHDPEAAALAAHLLDCPDCAADAEVTRQVRAVLLRLSQNEPQPLAAARLRRFAGALTNERG